MAKRESAGILLYRQRAQEWQFFLVHHGGPFWRDKDVGAWSICKGELAVNEQPLQAAIREFKEETGADVMGPFIELTPILQKAGKKVYAWAAEGNLDSAAITCNMFTLQWPPRSGKWQTFPEVDQAAWFNLEQAKQKINAAQVPLLDELLQKLTNGKGE